MKNVEFEIRENNGYGKWRRYYGVKNEKHGLREINTLLKHLGGKFRLVRIETTETVVKEGK